MASRLYSLFEVHRISPNRVRYQRISNIALPKPNAVSFWQSALLAFVLGETEKPRCLRPVKQGFPLAEHRPTESLRGITNAFPEKQQMGLL